LGKHHDDKQTELGERLFPQRKGNIGGSLPSPVSPRHLRECRRKGGKKPECPVACYYARDGARLGGRGSDEQVGKGITCCT